MRNQKGITLVALVVTIVVLLILAGVSIAMLTGDNGIITNAQKSKAGNTEGEVIDRMNFAYNTVKAEIIVDSSLDSEYDATSKFDDFAELIYKELGISTSPEAGYTVTPDATAKTITITYDDGKTFSATEGATYSAITCTMTFETDDVSYTAPTRQVTALTTDGADGE